jgi:uncharacterized protein
MLIFIAACSGQASDSGSPAHGGAQHVESPASPPTTGRCQPPGEIGVCTAECDAGHQASCAVLGLLHVNDASGRNLQRGIQLLETSCDAKVPLGCGGLGSVLVLGAGVPKDVERARRLFVFACGARDGLSCESLGGLFMMGQEVPTDLLAAARWYEKACDLGRPAACAFYAGAIADGVLGPDADRSRIPPLLEKACDGEVDVACKLLGDAYARGEHVLRDPQRAAQLYARACALGSRAGCEAAATP